MIPAHEESVLEFKLTDRDRSQTAHDWERERTESELDVPSYYKRRSAGVWTCLAALTVALGVAIVYGYSVLKEEGIQIEPLPGMTKSLSAMGQHLGNLERRLADSRADQQKLAKQVQSIDAGSKAALELTQQQTASLVAHAQAVLQKNLNQQSSVFKAQVAQLASERDTERAYLAQVEEQLAATRSELETARTDYTRQVEALREQQEEEHHELASLSNSLPTREVAFEIQKNQRAEIRPGIFFHLTKTDVRHQRYDGFIELRRDNQKVTVQGQGLRTPVVFFPSEQQGKAYVMVITNVNQNGAGGYLLFPTKNGTAGVAEFISTYDSGSQISPAPLPASH